MASKILTGDGLVAFAKSKVGTPYFYGSKIQYGVLTETFMETMHKSYPSVVTAAYMKKARNKGMVGKVCVDCSGLIYGYTSKCLGSAQLCANASKKLSPSAYKDWPNGVVVWRQGHVGIFAVENGKYYVYEAKGIDYGTVKSVFKPSAWTYGLQFSWISYSDPTATKATNPYKEPTVTVKYGSTGVGVQWVQWELRQAGYDKKFKYGGKTYSGVTIDGDFGKITEAAVKSFQTSAKCKLVDGEVGKETRSALKAN